jgi:hypothetical protein
MWGEPPLAQLHYRLRFTMKRFARHAPYYQFVIWVRQFLLTAIAIIPDIALGLKAGEPQQ